MSTGSEWLERMAELERPKQDPDDYICGHLITNCDVKTLVREYRELGISMSDRMFGHNAARARNKVGAELIARGITEIETLAGWVPIEINHGRIRG